MPEKLSDLMLRVGVRKKMDDLKDEVIAVMHKSFSDKRQVLDDNIPLTISYLPHEVKILPSGRPLILSIACPRSKSMAKIRISGQLSEQQTPLT